MEFQKLATPRRFFKIMMPGFQTKLNLPPLFCKKIEQQKSKVATLKSHRGSCEIQVRRNYSTGVISFRQGWSQFVAHHNLSVGDFLVFEHLGTGLHFKVYVFDNTACEKEYEPELDEEEEEAGRQDKHLPKKKREAEKESVSESPHFIVTMKPHHAHKDSILTIPAGFVKANNLEEKTRNVRLRVNGGRTWTVNLLVSRKPAVRMRFDRGWRHFYASNEIKEGDVCVFYLLESSTFVVKIYRPKNGSRSILL